MPTGHRKWKCLAKQIRLAEEVALTALPGYSDARRYYKVQGIREESMGHYRGKMEK